MSILFFKKLSENAVLPKRGSKDSAGYDLFSAVETIVPKKGVKKIDTDLQMSIPIGCYGRIAPRSGLALKNFIDVGGGVIDPDFRGNVAVILFNFGETDFEVKKGDRIAQIIFEKIYLPIFQEVSSNVELDATVRARDGFGSTGV